MIGFEKVAGAAGGDDIIPACFSAFAARDDVIEGQLMRWQVVIAVLAGKIIAQEDVEPGESGTSRGRYIFSESLNQKAV
ncbi:hypothetical protein GGR01_002152 [Acetobacter oeni]|nr:hypothetical protein [Acetobacter oeni]